MSSEVLTTAEIQAPPYPGAGGAAETATLMGASSGQSQMRRNLKRFLIGNKLNLIGLIIVIVFFILAIFGQILAPYDPYAQDITGSKLLPLRRALDGDG